jgi:SAM-dependent methyltransferase
LWGARARDWAGIEEQQVPTYEEAIARVDIRPGQLVLDIGCGTGIFLRLAADRGAIVYGVDASESLLAITRERVRNSDLRLGEMQSLPWPNDFFDVVAGFNSFFYAADMVAAVCEAGRVAKPGAPVIIQVWGRPERCSLDAMKLALARFLPPPAPDAPPPQFVWEPGVLEGIAAEAGLTPRQTFDVSWAYEFPDEAALSRAMLSPGLVVPAIRQHGEEPVRSAIVEALAPHRNDRGAYRLANEWHCLIASRDR